MIKNLLNAKKKQQYSIVFCIFKIFNILFKLCNRQSELKGSERLLST
jgi:hypothetical protein